MAKTAKTTKALTKTEEKELKALAQVACATTEDRPTVADFPKSSADVKPIGSKGKAGKSKTIADLQEARSLLGTKFNSIPLINEKGRKTKTTFEWLDMFQAAQVSQVSHDAMTQARKEYVAKSASISQQMLSMSRVVGKSKDKFNQVYKAMIIVFKEENKRKVPQSIYDAASVIRRAYARDINPNTYGSVESLRKEITAHDKKLSSENVGVVVENASLKSSLHNAAKMGKLLLATDEQLSSKFIADINKLIDTYSAHVVESNSETKKTGTNN